MTLGLLTCIWRRPLLTSAFLRYWSDMDVPGVEIERVAVVSPEDVTLPLHRSWGRFRVAHAPNDHLSRKWTAGMQAMEGADVDAVMIMGSDDFASPEYVQAVAEAVQAGADYVMPRSLWVLDGGTGRCLYGEFSRVGCGRVLSRRALDLVGWQPWEEAKAIGLDGAMDRKVRPIERHLRRVDMNRMRPKGQILVDVKTDENLWSFRTFAEKATERGYVDADGARVLAACPGLAPLLEPLRETQTTKQEA